MVTGDSRISPTEQLDPGSQRVQVRRAALASAIGTTIEWYDFFLYNTAAALVFPHLFFPASSAGLGYQLASVFAGGPAPLLATWLLHETGTPYSISAYIVVAAVITVVCCLALPDRSRVDIDDSAVYSRPESSASR
jgi:hypothetical protein